MTDLPSQLLQRPFTLAESRALGVSRRVLARHFVRLHHEVWVHRRHEMTWHDRFIAARLAMPESACPTGITRIRLLGLDYGPPEPIRFVIQGDHHLAIAGVFLHRTKRMPPLDESGVTPAAAFIAYCGLARVIDAIKVGDWLLRHEHMTIEEVRALALRDLWRDGAQETVWVLQHLDARSRSLPESELRVLLVFAGLPRPELNVAVDEEGQVVCDLYYRKWRTAVEHEGAHHQTDRAQYNLDLGRYAWMRAHDVSYVQSTHEKLHQPRSVVGEVYAELVRRGFTGPPPAFGERWSVLFARLKDVVGAAQVTRGSSATATNSSDR